MTWDHDRVEELLAGYVLGGLDAEDASLAERALEEHVPECERCRKALESFRLLAGDLALAAAPVQPPETLGVRIRRRLAGQRRRMRRGWGVAGIAAVAVAGLAAWNAILVQRLDHAESGQKALSVRLAKNETRQGWLAEAVTSAAHPQSEVVPASGPGDARVVVLYAPGDQHMYVIATHMPEPQWGYRVWLTRPGRSWSPATMNPVNGVAMVRVSTEPDTWHVVMITDEPATDTPTPQASPVVVASFDDS
jgi:hypothetical protein